MKALALSTLLVLVPSAASAGEVFGKVTEAGAAAVNASVEAKCGDKSFPAVTTDKSGSYHLVLDKTGKCSLTIKYKEGSASLDIASYDDPVQVDVALEAKEGKLTARRK